MKAFLTLGSFALVSVAGFAQNTSPEATDRLKARQALAVAIANTKEHSCPVELSAKRSPDSGLIQTSPAGVRRGQDLRLSFTPANAHGIAHAEFTVYGTSGAQVSPAGARSARHATEIFDVAPTSGEHHRFSTVVYLKRLTWVDYIHVNSLTFADGSEWHSSAASTCQVTPDGFRLVALGN